MPKRCIVAGCSKTSKDGVSLFRFPREDSLRQKWTAQVKRTRLKWGGPSDSTSCVVCSDHFTSDCFDETPALKASLGYAMRIQRVLLPSAIPTVFSRVTPKGKVKERTAVQKRERQRVSRNLRNY